MVDGALLHIIDYFQSVLVNLECVAMEIGEIMAVLGIIWTGFEMVTGTKDVQKFLVGNIVKFSMFFLVMYSYRPAVNTLLAVATQIAQQGSSQSIGAITDAFTDTLNNKVSALQAITGDIEQISNQISNYTNILKDPDRRRVEAAVKNMTDDQYIVYAEAQQDALRNKSRKKTKASDMAQKKINSVKEVLSSAIGDAKDSTGGFKGSKYALNLDFKRNGKSTGFLSPDALINMAILTGKIMVENELALDVYAEANDLTAVLKDDGSTVYELGSNGKAQKALGKKKGESVTADELEVAVSAGMLTIPLQDIPFGAFMRYGICWICVIILLATVVAGIIQYLMAIGEYFITTSVSILLVPLMLFDTVKDYSVKIIATLFGQVLKLIVITLMMYFCVYVLMDLAVKMTSNAAQFGVVDFANVLFSGLLIFIFTSHAPSMAQTIASGSPTMSMNEFMRGVGAAGAGIGAAVGAASLARGMAKGGFNAAASTSRGIATGVMSARNGAASAAARGLGKKAQVAAAFGNVGSDIGTRVRDSFVKTFGASEHQRNRAKQINGVAALRDNKNNPNGAHQAKIASANAPKESTGAFAGSGNGLKSGSGGGGGSGSSKERTSDMDFENILV